MSAEQLRALRAECRYGEGLALYRSLMIQGQADAEIHLLGAQMAKASGDFLRAREALESALDKKPSGAVLGTARFVLGILLREMGEVHSAIELFTLWLSELPLYPDLTGRLRGAALYNRALAYRSARRYDDGIRDYTEACEEFRLRGEQAHLRQALQNLAWVACFLGDSADAQEALDEARPLCIGPEALWQQRLGEAFLESIVSDPPVAPQAHQLGAIALCQKIIDEEGEGGPSVEVRSQACWLAGRLSLRLGRIADAEGFAQRALNYGVAAKSDTRCLYDAADLLREVHQVRAFL